ncbi:MAG: FGGY-family carbohydrate kinase [Anaerolineales bacterium]|nr:FGGY-family carbohydrate kinase [Anaerolineales bacterium]
MDKDLILAIDNGTQSVRAIIFDLQGNMLAKSRVLLQPYFSEYPGWAEQQVEYYWQSLCQACQQLWQQAPDLRPRVAGVALTTQRSTIINVDEQGKPLRPAIVWMDQRRTMGLKPVGGLWGLAFRLAGMKETVAYLQSEAEANWIRTYQPEVWDQTYKYLFLSGYLTYRLTGKFVDSIGCQVGYMPFDYKGLRWAPKSDWKWQALPMQDRMLVDLVPPAGKLGEITDEAAEGTGIPAGLPMIAAAADKACEAIGAGCLEPQIGCISYGTTANISTIHSKYIEPVPLIPPYPAAIPGSYALEIQIYRGFWMVSWFKEEFGHHEQVIAAQRGVEPEVLFDQLIEKVPPGSMGLILQPYWTPGLKYPGPEAKGAVIGFGDVHTRAHFYRAILEGLAYGLREEKERLDQRTKVPLRELRISGGGSQSNAAMQITADIFGLPTTRPHLYETSALGAAIDGAVGLGLHPDFATAVRSMTRIRQVFEPIKQNQEMYDALYRDVYKTMYRRLQPLYEKIREITGYPAR